MKLWLKMLWGAVAVVSLVYLFRPMEQPARQTRQDVSSAEEKSSFNILLLGCDQSGLRPDSIMLIHVDGGGGRISLLSLPRDSKVQYEGKTRKLNTVMVLDGKEALEQKISQLTGITVDYYICLKTGVFAKVVDALGGVEYTVEQDMYYRDPAQNLYIDLQAGTQTLTGEQCEQYCRYRNYVMGDLTRTQNQQKMLDALIRQKMTPAYIMKLPALYNIIRENAQTDISAKDISLYLPLMRSMTEGQLQIERLDCPGEYNDMEKEGISYYQIDQKALYNLCLEHFKTP